MKKPSGIVWKEWSTASGWLLVWLMVWLMGFAWPLLHTVLGAIAAGIIGMFPLWLVSSD